MSLVVIKLYSVYLQVSQTVSTFSDGLALSPYAGPNNIALAIIDRSINHPQQIHISFSPVRDIQVYAAFEYARKPQVTRCMGTMVDTRNAIIILLAMMSCTPSYSLAISVALLACTEAVIKVLHCHCHGLVQRDNRTFLRTAYTDEFPHTSDWQLN